jgi:flagellar basal body rod protein FlgG
MARKSIKKIKLMMIKQHSSLKKLGNKLINSKTQIKMRNNLSEPVGHWKGHIKREV